jgi:hypothetical protein
MITMTLKITSKVWVWWSFFQFLLISFFRMVNVIESTFSPLFTLLNEVNIEKMDMSCTASLETELKYIEHLYSFGFNLTDQRRKWTSLANLRWKSQSKCIKHLYSVRLDLPISVTHILRKNYQNQVFLLLPFAHQSFGFQIDTHMTDF